MRFLNLVLHVNLILIGHMTWHDSQMIYIFYVII